MNKGYKRHYQAKLLTRLGIQARSLPVSRSNLASYAYEYLWSSEVLLLMMKDDLSRFRWCLKEKVWGAFYRGTMGPVGPWIHGNIKSEPLIRTNLEQWRRLNLGGCGEPTFEAEDDRWGQEADRPIGRAGRPHPSSSRVGSRLLALDMANG
jgi:hypothetical protein